MKNHNWCEYYGYKHNENLEIYFELEFEDYFKKCVKQNKKNFGKKYTQKDLVLNEELQEIKKQIFERI